MRLWPYTRKKKKSGGSGTISRSTGSGGGGSVTTTVQRLLSPTPPSSCADALPAAQALSVACCYDSNGFGDLSTNNHGMFAHATATGNFWHVAAEASGFGSGPYPVATPTRTWYLLEPTLTGCGLQEGNPIALPAQTADFQSTQTPQSGTCGKSDERCYLISLASINPNITIGNDSFANTRAYFGAQTGVSFFLLSSGGGFSASIGLNTWCKFGDHFYSPENFGGFGPTDWRMASFPVPAPLGTIQDASVPLASVLPGWSNSTMGTTNILSVHATNGFLWILASAAWDGGATEVRLVKVNRSTMRYVTHWTLTGDVNFPTPFEIHAFSDSLIFLIQGGTGGNPWKIGYFRPDTATTVVIGTLAQQCTQTGNGSGAPGQHGFYYAKNYFYLSYSGSGNGTTNVLKIGQLVCPSNPDLPWEDF